MTVQIRWFLGHFGPNPSAHRHTISATRRQQLGQAPAYSCYPDALPCFQVALLLCGRALCKTSPNRPWANPCCSGLAHGRKAMRHSPGPGNRRRAPGACAYVNSSCASRATKRISGNRTHGAGRSADSANWRRTSASHWQDWVRYEARFPRQCALVALQRATWSPTWPLLAEPVEL